MICIVLLFQSFELSHRRVFLKLDINWIINCQFIGLTKGGPLTSITSSCYAVIVLAKNASGSEISVRKIREPLQCGHLPSVYKTTVNQWNSVKCLAKFKEKVTHYYAILKSACLFI